jgi:translation initiation factor 2B subunit (eIF-2B alpha/beta/delta family)
MVLMEHIIREAKDEWKEQLIREKEFLAQRLNELEKKKVILETRYDIVWRVYDKYHKPHYREKIRQEFLEPLEREIEKIEAQIEEARTEKYIKGNIIESLIEELC